MGLTKHKAKTTPEAAPAAVETTKKATAAAVAAEATPVDVSEIGKKSGTIAFVAPLGDPSHADNTYTKGANGENIKATTAYIVGYRFKALEDMTVPECGLDKDATKNLMSYIDPNGTRQVKAGEEFNLTRFEVGMLLSPAEFNGKITGEGKSFSVVYQGKPGSSTASTSDARVANGVLPTVAIRPETGSIKDYNIIEVLSVTTKEEEINGKIVKRKIKTINPGFEKFEALCATAAPRARKATQGPKVTRNQKAAMFLDMVKKMG